MAYKKIYYDDIWAITSKSSAKCDTWLKELSDLNDKLDAFKESFSFKGRAADSMKNYVDQVHGVLIQTIRIVLLAYSAKARSYYIGYKNSVDSGDGSDYGLRYTTIVYDEVNETTGSVEKALQNILNMANSVAADANKVKYSISGLVNIAAAPKTSNLESKINKAINKAKDVSRKAIDFETSRLNDFYEIDNLIAEALSIINHQLGQSRVPVVKYQQGEIGAMCDIGKIQVNLEAASNIVTSFQESEEYEEAMSLSVNRDALLQEEEEAGREWIQWVTVGIAAVGAIALTVVTAGGAGPGACILVGSLVGGVTTASGKFADNYVKTGSLTEGMDWSEFGKDVLINTAVGGVSGYLGSISTGSAIQQPIQKAGIALGKKVATETTEGVLTMAWDVGEAVITGKPGNEIKSILADDALDMTKDILVEGSASFVGGYVTGTLGIDTSDKGYLQKLGEKTLVNGTESLAKGSVKTVWEVGEAVIDPHSSKTIKSILEENVKESASDFIGNVAGDAISEGFSGIDDIKNSTLKVVAETAKDATAENVEKVSKGVTGRTLDYVFGKEKDSSKILGDVWKEDLKKGKTIAQSVVENAGKKTVGEVYKDQKLYNDLKKIDKDKDGKIDVVQFGDYTVTKQDYDAAVSNAGKGAYKGKTAQDILGLSKDTDLSMGKERTVSINMTEKYTSSRKTTDTVTIDGKYTFKKDYYEAAVNVAGKEGYENKTVQDVLGIPKETDISENNITQKRVPNSDIGRNKKVTLTNDSGTQATKLHISSMKHETKVAREKQKEQNKTDEK